MSTPTVSPAEPVLPDVGAPTAGHPVDAEADLRADAAQAAVPSSPAVPPPTAPPVEGPAPPVEGPAPTATPAPTASPAAADGSAPTDGSPPTAGPPPADGSGPPTPAASAEQDDRRDPGRPTTTVR